MNEIHLKELDYGFSIAVSALIKAMGMFSENMQRKVLRQGMAYVKEDFEKLLSENGLYHNSILTRWNRLL